MRFRYLFFLTTAALLCSIQANAQYYTLGNDPFTSWRQISTDNYNIIYPSEIDSLARSFAANMESVRQEVLRPTHSNPSRTAVILHPYSVKSNGSVAWAPKRIDLYTTPSMYNYMAEPWEYHLTVHESRHLGQMAAFNGNLFKIGSYILGEQAIGLAAGLYTSGAFLEGDATAAETELSRSGRGRNADFLKFFRASLISGDTRSYDRWKLGSLRYYTPNKYLFGYIMTSCYKARTGNYDYCGEYMKNISDRPFSTDAIFGSNGDNASGSFNTKNYEATIAGMSALWKQDDSARAPFTHADDIVLNKKERYYTEYTSPVLVQANASIYAVKSGMSCSPVLVKIDPEHKTERILRQFSVYASKIAERNKILYWSETVNRGKWQLLDYSEIHSYDLNSGQSKAVTYKTRFFHPAPSFTGDTIAVSEIPSTGSSFLTLIDNKGTRIGISLEAPDKGSIKEIAWTGKRIYCIIVTYDGLGLYSTDFQSGWKTEIEPQFQNIHNLREGFLNLDGANAACLIFSSDVDGVGNIYAFVPDSGEVIRLTNSRFGADYPYSSSEGGIIYSHFGLDGYRPVYSSPDNLEYEKTDMAKPFAYPLAETNSKSGGNPYPKPSKEFTARFFDKDSLPSERYDKGAHFFNIHSWTPFYLNPETIMDGSFARVYDVAAIGATLFSQNELGTATSSLAYSYASGNYTKEYMHAGHLTFNYTGVMPNIEVKVHLNSEMRSILAYSPDSTDTPTIDRTCLYDGGIHVSGSLRLYENFKIYSDGWYRTISPFVQFNWSNDKAYDAFRNIYGTTSYIYGGITYTQVTQRTAAMIFPRYGFGVSVRVLGPANISGPSLYSSQYSALLYGYLPGIFPTHGLKISLCGAIEDRKHGQGVFSTGSLVSLPRGYNIPFSDINTSKYAIATADYAFGIYLGDISLGSVVYLKRLQAIPFADVAINKRFQAGKEWLYSYGSDFLLDFNAARFSTGISAGIRYARTAQYGNMNRNHFTLLLSINM